MEEPLELQTCDATTAAQRFALDGDFVLMGTQTSGHVTREYVIEPMGDATPNGTRLVVGTRDTSDAEYFRLQSIDGSTTPPTTGWVHVQPWSVAPADGSLATALTRGWGTVIDIDAQAPYLVTETREIPAGVTIRGVRKHTSLGPTILFGGSTGPVFVAAQDNVRITGLRVGSQSEGPWAIDAIKVVSDNGQCILIDHVEVTNWNGTAIVVQGGDALDSDDNPGDTGKCDLPGQQLELPRRTDVRVMNSFVHNNASYGIVTGNGAFLLAQGNVVYFNQHSIASDPWRRSGYAAYDNFVLDYSIDSEETSNQDFDAHGSHDPGHWQGGIAGDYFDIGWNTFLQHDHYNFNLRGTPCRLTKFHDNLANRFDPVLVQADANYQYGYNVTGVSTEIDSIAAGDFEGDGVTDLFHATGVTWWFSSGGQTEWRFLNRMPEKTSRVTFGDYDGDGRTDVRTMHGSVAVTSWGGISPWL